MTNSVAVPLGALILGALALDVALVGDAHMVFLAKKLLALIEWLAFWR